MSTDRIAVVEGNLDAFLARATAAPGRLEGDAPLRQEGGPTARQAVRLFEDQVLCRALDVTARRLKRRDLSYYTISSAGHEQNGCLGALLRPTDPCFLHYRADVCRATAEEAPDPALRGDVWAGALPENATAPTKRTLAAHINAALADEMARHKEIMVFGEDVGLYGVGDVLLVSYANGVRLSLRAARTLERDHGIATRVLDLRWLNPLPLDELRHHADACGSVVVVDECRATGGGIADAVTAHLGEAGYRGRLRSVRAADCYVPLGPSAAAVLVSEADIVAAVREAAS